MFDLYAERAVGGLHLIQEKMTLGEAKNLGRDYADKARKLSVFGFTKPAIQFTVRQEGKIVYMIGLI